jgi:hypothetical protein
MDVKEAYNNLTEIVRRGYLLKGFKYGIFNVVLKSLTVEEIRYIREINNLSTTDDIDELDKLLYSTYSISGDILLKKDLSHASRIKDFYSRCPSFLVRKLLRGVEELFIDYIESSRFLEGYCFTEESRVEWSCAKARAKLANNIYNTDSAIVEQWAVINTRIDEEDNHDRELDNALFIAASFNPKGVKSTANSIRLEKSKRRKEREEIAKYGFSKRRVEANENNDKWSKPLVTNEDLVRELNRSIRGEKDKHDLYIEEWLKRKDEAAKRREKEKAERAKSYRKELESVSLDIEGSRRASPEEVAKVLARRDKSGLSKYSSSYANLGKSDGLMKKIGSRVLKGSN